MWMQNNWNNNNFQSIYRVSYGSTYHYSAETVLQNMYTISGMTKWLTKLHTKQVATLVKVYAGT